MREIKFRVWDKSYNAWYDFESGDLDYVGDNPCIAFFNLDDDFEVMQFTGLKDKNGKEVYEGDILNCGYNIEKGIRGKVVEFITEAKGGCSVGCFALVGKSGKYSTMWGYNTSNILQVTGNKFENPELLDANGGE